MTDQKGPNNWQYRHQGPIFKLLQSLAKTNPDAYPELAYALNGTENDEEFRLPGFPDTDKYHNRDLSFSFVELEIVSEDGGYRPIITLIPSKIGEEPESIPFLNSKGNPLMGTYERAEEVGIAVIWGLYDYTNSPGICGPFT